MASYYKSDSGFSQVLPGTLQVTDLTVTDDATVTGDTTLNGAVDVNAAMTTRNITVDAASKIVTDRIDVDDLFERTASNGVDVNNRLDILGGITNLRNDLLGDSTAASVNPFTNIDQTCYAQYVGRAPTDITTAELTVELSGTAAVTVVYAELALATGDYEAANLAVAGTPLLTLVAGSVADISVEVAGGTNRNITKTVTPTTPIKAGTELWLLVSVDAGTQPTWRANSRTGSMNASKTATRPSTMAADSEFTGGTLAVASSVPNMYLNILS